MDTMLLVDHGKTDTTKQIKTDYIVCFFKQRFSIILEWF